MHQLTVDPAAIVLTVDAFRASLFCLEHRCEYYPQLSTPAETGRGEYFFQIDDLRDTSVTLGTRDGTIVRYSISLGDRAEGQSEDINVAFSFLSIIDPGLSGNDTLKEFVRTNINEKVSQICEAAVTEVGQFNMWVGRPHVQVIVVASECEA